MKPQTMYLDTCQQQKSHLIKELWPIVDLTIKYEGKNSNLKTQDKPVKQIRHSSVDAHKCSDELREPKSQKWINISFI